MRAFRRFFAFGLSVFFSLCSTAARAQETDGRFRLGLEGVLWGTQKLEASLDGEVPGATGGGQKDLEIDRAPAANEDSTALVGGKPNEPIVIRNGVLTLRVALPNQTEMHLLGRPGQDASRAIVHLTMYGAAPLDQCRSFQVAVDERSEELRDVRYRAEPIASGGVQRLQGATSIDTLAGVATARSTATLRACEQQWRVSPDQLKRIAKFIEVFRTHAVASQSQSSEASSPRESVATGQE